MKWVHNARTMRTAGLTAALLLVCLPMGWARGRQHPNASRAAQRDANAQGGGNDRMANRQGAQMQARPQGNYGQRAQQAYPQRPYPQQAYPGAGARPGYGAGGYGQPGYNGGQRPAYAGQGANAANAPRGHLEDWLNQHRNVTVQDQERMLQSYPSFRRLAPADQQRLTQQLRQVDRMPEQQRERRLARNEMLERLSPEERMSINRSGRDWAALPPGRQIMMKQALQTLRGVPLDQREMVLNSARYQSTFTPQERGILSDFLKVEPYEAPR